jgi:hypothetical protein
LTWLVASPEGVTGVGLVGGGRGWRGLSCATLVVLVADGTVAADNTVRPVTPLVLNVIKELLSIPHFAVLLLCCSLVALEVLHAVVIIREEASVCGACEVCWWWVWLAWPSVAVPGSACDLLREVAPLVLVVVQVVTLTQQVAGTTVVTLVVQRAMVWVRVEVGSSAFWAGLVVWQGLGAVADLREGVSGGWGGQA